MAITISGNGITSANIADGTITDTDVDSSKIVTTDSNGKTVVSNLHAASTDEITKQQIGSMPKLLSKSGGGGSSAGQLSPFATGWSSGFMTSNTLEETVSSGTVWSSRSASSQELLTLMGRANVQHFVSSFEIRRVTAVRASGGYTFPYQQVPYGRSWTSTHAAFVKWVSGPLPYGWWCEGLVADGNWHWCHKHTSGTNHHYNHTHPYLPANDGTPSVLLVALPGTVDKKVDDPTQWQVFGEIDYF